MFTRFTAPIEGAKDAIVRYLSSGVTDIDVALDTISNDILPMYSLTPQQQAVVDRDISIYPFLMTNALQNQDSYAVVSILRTMLSSGLGDPQEVADVVASSVANILTAEMADPAALDFVARLYQILKAEKVEEAGGDSLLHLVKQTPSAKHPAVEYEWAIVGADTPELRSRRAQNLYKLAVSSRNQDLLEVAIRYGATAPVPIGYPNMRCTVEKLECSHYEDRARIEHFRQLEKEQKAFFRLNPISKARGCETSDPAAYYVAWNNDGADGEILCGAMTVMYHAPLRAIYVPYFETQSSLNPNIRGVGGEIMKRLIQDCEASDISFIFLFALTAAVPFYEKFGFLPVPGTHYMFRPIRAMPPDDTDFEELANDLSSVPRRIWRRPRGQNL